MVTGPRFWLKTNLDFIYYIIRVQPCSYYFILNSKNTLRKQLRKNSDTAYTKMDKKNMIHV